MLPTMTMTSIKRRTGPSILGVLIAFTVAVAEVANATGQPPQVRYEVSGNSAVAEYLSYQTDTGQQQQANVKLPWSTQFTAFGGEVFVLSAQGPGSITCRILINGNMVNQATANGQPARTVCSH
jgi:Mycobacterium membrane protein